MTAPTLIALIDTAGRGEEDGIGIASSSPRKTGSPHRASLPAQSWSGAGAVSHAVDARDGIDHVAFEVGVDGLVGRRNRQRRNVGAAVRIWPENGSAECGEDFQPPIAAAITAAQEVAAAVRSLGSCAAGETGLDIASLLQQRVTVTDRAQVPSVTTLAPEKPWYVEALPEHQWPRLLVTTELAAETPVQKQSQALLDKGFDLELVRTGAMPKSSPAQKIWKNCDGWAMRLS